MNKYPTAFFVEYPFSIEDLRQPHLLDSRKPYVIEKTITLAKIDYENFITDLCVDRWFIKENANFCKVDKDGIWHCIFVKQHRSTDGILVMSDGRVFAKWAAYIDSEVCDE